MRLRTVVLSTLFACGALPAPLAAQANPPVQLDARLAQPVMKGGETQKNYLRIGLQGCKPEPSQHRTPVNVAFVIDRSGSMAGSRIAQARAAAIMAVSRLSPDDIASVVIFDHRVEVLVPAQQVANPALFAGAIAGIGVGGETAIHSGMLMGALEVRKFKDPRRLNRIVLLSDGLANVGPSRPDDFERLGAAMLADGISVSTIGLGLGYNEDLMARLARAGDGNHAFARDPDDLVQIFNKEFDDVLGSCAQTVSIDVELKPGVRAVKALSREGVIEPQQAKFKMSQVYAATEHYVLLEVELDKELAATAGDQDLGIVRIVYTVPSTGAEQKLDAPIRGRFTDSEQEASASLDRKVSEAVVEQVTRDRAQRAVTLRDQGRYDEARELFQSNAVQVRSLMLLGATSPRLSELEKEYSRLGAQTQPAMPGQMNLERKMLRQLEAAPAGAATRY